MGAHGAASSGAAAPLRSVGAHGAVSLGASEPDGVLLDFARLPRQERSPSLQLVQVPTSEAPRMDGETRPHARGDIGALRQARGDLEATSSRISGIGPVAHQRDVLERSGKSPARNSQHASRLSSSLADGANVGFLFVKPHANVEEGRKCTEDLLARAGVSVIAEGRLTALEMNRDRVIDRHYRSLAAKAMDLCPEELLVQPQAAASFEATFGRSWAGALESGSVCNACQAMERLGLNEEQLGNRWAPLKLDKGKVKFGGGLYCGKIDSLFVINGFYMAMRDAYTRPGRSVQWYVAEWKDADISWGEFRENVLGATHPEDAKPSSLRGYFRDHWRTLGLGGPLHVGKNAVHASASAFEAMVERVNWLGISFEDDPFGRELVRRRVPAEILESWSLDPVVSYEGREASVFDLFENLGCLESIELATALLKARQSTPSRET